MKKYYPVMLDIEKKNCIIIGGGKVAYRKAKTLKAYNANVTVISANVCDELQQMISQAQISWISRKYEPGDLKNADLVFAATNNNEVNKEVYNEAIDLKISVNVVDDLELCNFILPSVLERGDLMLTVATGGKSPMLSKKIRCDLEELFGPEYAEYLDIMGQIRQLSFANISDEDTRKDLFRKLVYSNYLDMIRNGETHTAKSKMMSLYNDYTNKELLLSKYPLLKRCVLLPRTRCQRSRLTEKLVNAGATVNECQLFELKKINTVKNINIEEYQLLLFSSAQAVKEFISYLKANNIDIRKTINSKIIVVDDITDDSLKQYLIIADYKLNNMSADSIVAFIKEKTVCDDSILLINAEVQNIKLNNKLEEHFKNVNSIDFCEVEIAYKKADKLIEMIGKSDSICFSSTKMIVDTVKMLGKEANSLLNSLKVYCISNAVAEIAEEYNINVYSISEECSIESLYNSVVNDKQTISS